MFAARGIIDVSSCLTFYSTISSFSGISRHLPKHMVIAHLELPPTPDNLSLPGHLLKHRRYRDSRGIAAEKAKQMESHTDVQDKDVERISLY